MWLLFLYSFINYLLVMFYNNLPYLFIYLFIHLFNYLFIYLFSILSTRSKNIFVVKKSWTQSSNFQCLRQERHFCFSFTLFYLYISIESWTFLNHHNTLTTKRKIYFDQPALKNFYCYLINPCNSVRSTTGGI